MITKRDIIMCIITTITTMIFVVGCLLCHFVNPLGSPEEYFILGAGTSVLAGTFFVLASDHFLVHEA